MNEHVKRPNFDDKNETINNPLADRGTGTSSSESSATAQGDGDGRPLDLPVGVTRAEVDQGINVMFNATKRRMVILVQTLVKLAEQGDFAMWAPLGAMDEVLHGLDWTSVPPLAVAKFYKLLAMTLTTYGTVLDGHAMAVLESIKSEAALPTMPEWTADDTLKMYDMVEQLFAPSTEPGAPAMETEKEKVDE